MADQCHSGNVHGLAEAPEFSVLQNTAPGYHPPVCYHDADGKVIGYAITSTDTDLSPNLGIAEGIHSLLEKPVRYVLSLLIITLIFSGFLALRDTPAHPRNLP